MEKYDGDGGDLPWHEDPNWWASKGAKGIGLKEEDADKRKYMSASKMFKDGINKVFGKDKPLPPVGSPSIIKGLDLRGQGGGGGSSIGPGGPGGVGHSGAGVGGGPGQVIYGGATSQAQVRVDIPGGLDDKAKVEILKVKQALQRHIALAHMPANCVIAGGVFVSLFKGEPITDIDCFVLGIDENDLITLPDMAKPGKYTTMKNFENYTGRSDIVAIFNDTETKVQYIYTTVKTPRELLEAFDFTHCCCSYYDHKMWINARIYDAIQNKWLIPNIEPDMIRFERKTKFLARGFVEPGDLTNFYEKKLGGVGSA
jgi:hypothetical protein